MIKLIIKELGFTVKIPGVPEFKTPANLDITNIDLTKLTSSLKSSGVREFEIKNDDKIRSFKVFSKKSLVNNFLDKNIQPNNNNEMINLINKRFDKLEELILNLSNSSFIQKTITDTNERKLDNLDFDSNDIFIQEINTENMKINRPIETLIKNENRNIDDDVNSLSKILNKKI